MHYFWLRWWTGSCIFFSVNLTSTLCLLILQVFPPVVHHDIKSSNILLDNFMRARVCQNITWTWMFDRGRKQREGGHVCASDCPVSFNKIIENQEWIVKLVVVFCFYHPITCVCASDCTVSSNKIISPYQFVESRFKTLIWSKLYGFF